ncbi:hypothetical protein BLGI_2708 [Brevibacillus laterosporus GI-9]|nr:hypothetical protein BLGI_2708 [Brevibacillus laterosporus GI-9]
MTGICYNFPTTIASYLKGGRLTPRKDMPEGGENMEVYQALSLMFMFGMFLLALLTYLKKK